MEVFSAVEPEIPEVLAPLLLSTRVETAEPSDPSVVSTVGGVALESARTAPFMERLTANATIAPAPASHKCDLRVRLTKTSQPLIERLSLSSRVQVTIPVMSVQGHVLRR